MKLRVEDCQIRYYYDDSSHYKEWIYFSVGIPFGFGFKLCFKYDGFCKGFLWLGLIGFWWGSDYSFDEDPYC